MSDNVMFDKYETVSYYHLPKSFLRKFHKEVLRPASNKDVLLKAESVVFARVMAKFFVRIEAYLLKKYRTKHINSYIRHNTIYLWSVYAMAYFEEDSTRKDIMASWEKLASAANKLGCIASMPWFPKLYPKNYGSWGLAAPQLYNTTMRKPGWMSDHLDSMGPDGENTAKDLDTNFWQSGRYGGYWIAKKDKDNKTYKADRSGRKIHFILGFWAPVMYGTMGLGGIMHRMGNETNETDAAFFGRGTMMLKYLNARTDKGTRWALETEKEVYDAIISLIGQNSHELKEIAKIKKRRLKERFRYLESRRKRGRLEKLEKPLHAHLKKLLKK